MKLITTLSCHYFCKRKQNADSSHNFADSRDSTPNKSEYRTYQVKLPPSPALPPWNSWSHLNRGEFFLQKRIPCVFIGHTRNFTLHYSGHPKHTASFFVFVGFFLLLTVLNLSLLFYCSVQNLEQKISTN